MPAPSLLAANRLATTSGQRLTGGTSLAAVSGGAYGDGEGTGAVATINMAGNRIVEFKGELYAQGLSGGTGRVFRRTGGVWSSVFNSAAAITNSYYFSGLYVVNSGGTEYLCGIMQSAGNAILHRSTDGVSWSSAVATPGSVPFWQTNGVVYRGSVVFSVTGTSYGIGLFNPATLAITTIAIPAVSGEASNEGSGCPCVFNNRLFILKNSAASSRATRLYEIAGGGFVSRSADLNGVAHTSGAAPGNSCRSVLFPVGSTKMVCIAVTYEGGGVAQNRAYDFTPSGSNFITTEVTTAMLPVGLRTASAARINDGWTAFVDNDTAPASPAVYLWYANEWSTGSHSYYEYVSSAAEIGPGSVVGSANTYALTHQTRGGGEYVDTTDSDLFIDSVAMTPAPTAGRVTVSFRARGAPGFANKFVRGWFSATENTNMTQMTLAGTATGGSAVRVGNEIQQVDADPANTYTFEWDVTADGFTNGSPAAIMLRIGTT